MYVITSYSIHYTKLYEITVVDKGYSIDEEVKKIANSDFIIFQMPSWWMGTPWIIKRYVDEVFTAGHGILYASDGRSRTDLTKKYGSGGLLHGKKYIV